MIKVKENSRTKNSLLNIVSGLGSQLAMTILRFVTRTVFIQVLGSEYLGIGGLFTNILSLLSLTELGLDTAINFKLYKPLADKDEKRVRVLMKFYKQAYIVIGFVILALGLSMIPLLPLLIKDYDKLGSIGLNAPLVFILYLLQSVSSYLFFAYRTTIIKTAQKKYVLDIVDFFINLATLVAQIAVLYLFEDYLIYLSTIIVLTFVKNAVNAVIAHRMFPYAFVAEKDSISKTERNEIFKDCGALFVFKISVVVLKATDNIVLSSMIGLSIVGLYSNYYLLYLTSATLIGKFYVGIKASLGDVYAKEGIEKSYFLFEVVNFMAMILNGTACVGIAICANELIGVWLGNDFVIPQPFPVLIGIELLFSGLKINLNQVRNVSGVFRQAWKRPILTCIINVSVSIILCHYIGICGVIIGTISADILTNFLVDPSIIHRESFKYFRPVSYYYQKNLIYLGILAITGVASAFLCAHINTSLPLLDLFIHAAICGVAVPGVFFAIYWKSDVAQYLLRKARKKK